MWITLLILIPILFVIGTVVSALNEQKRLENGLLRKVIAQRAKDREEYLKKLAKNKTLGDNQDISKSQKEKSSFDD